MRAILAALIVCISALSFSAPAHAWWTTDLAQNADSRHSLVAHTRGMGRSHGDVRLAGGCQHLGRKQCGCIAMQIAGLSDTRFWGVPSWYSFPRTQPHVGAAAIWRSPRHVEIVTAVNGDGTVSTTGSVGFARVPISHLVFVDPHGR